MEKTPGEQSEQSPGHMEGTGTCSGRCGYAPKSDERFIQYLWHKTRERRKIRRLACPPSTPKNFKILCHTHLYPAYYSHCEAPTSGPADNALSVCLRYPWSPHSRPLASSWSLHTQAHTCLGAFALTAPRALPGCLPFCA